MTSDFSRICFPPCSALTSLPGRGARLADLDDQQVRQRAFAALRRLFEGIAERSTLILFIDDLQWGDADSAQALFEVLRPPEPSAILLLGSYRSDEAERSPFLAMLSEIERKHNVQLPRHEVQVGPLTAHQCLELMILLTGKDSELIHRRAAEFFQETGGNPFFLLGLIGCFDAETDSFRPLPLHEVIDRKLDQLPSDARRLLEVVAVSNQALSAEELSQAAGQDAPAMATITHMRSEKLVRLVGLEKSSLVDTYHDKIRETVLGTMLPDARRETHRSLAEVIEADSSDVFAGALVRLEQDPFGADEGQPPLPRVYDLSYHYDAAGETDKAWRYAVLAAEQARRQSALEVAAIQYAVARRNKGDSSDTIRYRLAVGNGETLMLLGDYEEANRVLQGAIDRVDDDEHKAQIDLLQGEIAFKQGLVDRSVEFYEQGLRRLGKWVPDSVAGLVFGIAKETWVQCFHSWFSRRLHRRQRSRRLELTARLTNHLSLNNVFQNTFKCLWSHLSALNQSELMPPSVELLYSYAAHGCWMTMFGLKRRGDAYGVRALTIAEQLNNDWGIGVSHNYRGIGVQAAARFELGITQLREALRAFEKAGDKWEAHLAHFHKACCHYGRGELAEAIRDASAVIESSVRLGDSRSLCASFLLARATRGNIPFEELKSRYPCRPDDVMSTVHGIMAEGLWHAYHRRTSEELATFECAAEMIKESHCINSHMILVLPLLAAACRHHADTLRSQDPGESRRLLRRSLRLARWAARVTRLFPAVYPLSLRELSLSLAAHGKTKTALRAIDTSLAVAQRQQARYEHAQSSLVRGRLARGLGLPEADEQIQRAEAELKKFDQMIQEPFSPEAVLSN